MSKKQNKLTLIAFILMILTSVFGVSNIGTAFYRMGYAAIPMFVIAGILFFIPFTIMMVELGTGFNNQKGGIYTWMEHSVSPKFAFVGIMMWYSSYIIWMFSKAYSMWIPLSFTLLGKDVTVYKIIYNDGFQVIDPSTVSEATLAQLNTQIDFMQCILGVIAVLIVVLLSYIVANGASRLAKVSAIGGIAVIAMNLILLIGGLIAFFVNGMTLQHELTASSFLVSPNPSYTTLFPFLGFVVFAVFAYGGTEAIAGIAEDLENPKKDLKKGLFLSAGFIILCYVLGILMVGAALDWSQFGEGVTSLSALFIIMQNLGDTITGVDNSLLGEVFMRFSGLGMFLAYVGAFVTLAYAPLKQLIDGTPKEIWPESFQKENKHGVKAQAVKVQALIVILFIVAKFSLSLFNPEGAAILFELIIQMTNVGMTLPYLFLIYAWYKYRNDDKLNKDVIMVNSKLMIKLIFLITFIVVAFGNVFTIISPFIPGDGQSISTGVWTIIGPIIFFVIAMVMYKEPQDK